MTDRITRALERAHELVEQIKHITNDDMILGNEQTTAVYMSAIHAASSLEYALAELNCEVAEAAAEDAAADEAEWLLARKS